MIWNSSSSSGRARTSCEVRLGEYRLAALVLGFDVEDGQDRGDCDVYCGL